MIWLWIVCAFVYLLIGLWQCTFFNEFVQKSDYDFTFAFRVGWKFTLLFLWPVFLAYGALLKGWAVIKK